MILLKQKQYPNEHISGLWKAISAKKKKEEESVEITAEELDDTSQNETIDIPEDEVKPAES